MVGDGRELKYLDLAAVVGEGLGRAASASTVVRQEHPVRDACPDHPAEQVPDHRVYLVPHDHRRVGVRRQAGVPPVGRVERVVLEVERVGDEPRSTG
jgi:hypothetical protein